MPKHYLEKELDDLVQSDEGVWAFIQEASLDGLWYWNLEKPDEEWMSPDFWRLFGIDPATKAHDPAEWQDLIFEEDLKVALGNFEKHCADPSHPYDQVVRYHHVDGSTIWVRCRGKAIRDKAGKPIRMLGAHNDITPFKNAEAEAERGRLALDDALKDMKTFTYGLNHDLRAPVRSNIFFIREIAKQIEEGDLATAKQLSEITLGSLERLSDRIDYLLEYAAAVDGSFPSKTFTIHDVFTRVLEDLGPVIFETGATLNLEGDAQIKGRKLQIESLLQNLIDNSLKYRHPDRPPNVTVTVGEGPNGVSITVSDNGIGIEGKHLEYVLKPFNRLHRDEDITGSGLGLAASSRIVENHGGSIYLTSEVGGGTVVHVSLSAAT